MKLKKLLIIFILPFLFLISGCKDNSIIKASKNLSTYSIDIVYNEDHTLTCSQTVDYRNNSDTSLQNIMFHLYPRSFRQGAKSSVVSSLNYNKCYYNGASFGDIVINKISVNNQETDIEIVGNDEDIANVNLDTSLAPNDKVSIYFEYIVTIPNINHRFGYGQDTINLANFYPIACVYQDGEFVIDSYHYNGDPFFSEVSNYNVNITAPSNLVLASTGNIQNQETQNNQTTYNIKALTVRDFALVLSDKFSVVSDKVNNTTINYYYFKNQYPNEAIQASVDAVTTFNELFGEYPYETLNVVETNFVHGGMEYPNLVMISDMVDVQSDYINVIIHEIAHQWWYGMVGNDEYTYPWLDEALTEYSCLLFYDNNSGYNLTHSEMLRTSKENYSLFVSVYQDVLGDLDTSMRAVDEYDTEPEYTYCTYVKGVLMYESLYQLIGEKDFISGLKNYFNDNKYTNVIPSDIIRAFEKACGNELDNFFSSWIDGKVVIR